MDKQTRLGDDEIDLDVPIVVSQSFAKAFVESYGNEILKEFCLWLGEKKVKKCRLLADTFRNRAQIHYQYYSAARELLSDD